MQAPVPERADPVGRAHDDDAPVTDTHAVVGGEAVERAGRDPHENFITTALDSVKNSYEYSPPSRPIPDSL